MDKQKRHTGPIDASDYFESENHKEIARLVNIKEISENVHNLSIPLYVHNGTNGDGQSLESTIEAWQAGRPR